MLHKKIILDENDKDIYLDVYAADHISGFVRNAILVIPGGGYGGVCSDREGEPIAMAFMAHGYNAFVLHYSVGRKKPFPAQLIEASKAMKHIKDNAEEYNIDPDKVFVIGFSAGGHLAGSLGTMWHKKEIYDVIDMPFGYNKPAGMMLIYPVVSAIEDFSHYGSIYNLLCDDNPSYEQKEACGIENNVDSRSCPAYIVHTANDEIVNVRNSIALADAYAKNDMKFELHIFPNAPHGMALSNTITACGCKGWDNPHHAKWVELAAEWAETI
jgi:acetyl esterase/lipase